jgi:hypothetical protein
MCPRIERRNEMRISKAAMMLPIVGLAALMLMGNTKCGTGTSIGGGAASSPQIYTGLGEPPAVALPGQWVRVRGNVHGLPRWAYWPLGGALAGGAGGKLASWALADSGGAHASKGTMGSSGPYALNNNPCKDRQNSYLLAKWPARTKGGVRPIGKDPTLNCAGLKKVTAGRGGVPARWKDLLDCLTVIMTKGTPFRSAATGNTAFTYGTAAVIVNSADKVIGAYPPKGVSWAECAKM